MKPNLDELAKEYVDSIPKNVEDEMPFDYGTPMVLGFKSGYTRAIADVVAMLKEDYPADNDGPYRCGAWFASVIKNKFLKGET